jgi:hypothetical protein
MKKMLQVLTGTRLRLVIGFVSILYALLVLLFGQAWYSNQLTTSFHFFDDGPEWKQMDKWGHLFTSFQVSLLMCRLLVWGKVSPDRATRYGSLVAFLLVSSVEVPDGFSIGYGASVYDILANGAGCLLYFLQIRLWKALWVVPKFSFHFTPFAALRPSLLGANAFQEIIKDYNGQTYWFAVPVPVLRLPRWLNLAVGLGAEGMVRGRVEQNELLQLTPHRKYFFSFDINFGAFEPRSKILRSSLLLLNMIKVPAPTLEVSGDGLKFHLLYF